MATVPGGAGAPLGARVVERPRLPGAQRGPGRLTSTHGRSGRDSERHPGPTPPRSAENMPFGNPAAPLVYGSSRPQPEPDRARVRLCGNWRPLPPRRASSGPNVLSGGTTPRNTPPWGLSSPRRASPDKSLSWSRHRPPTPCASFCPNTLPAGPPPRPAPTEKPAPPEALQASPGRWLPSSSSWGGAGLPTSHVLSRTGAPRSAPPPALRDRMRSITERLPIDPSAGSDWPPLRGPHALTAPVTASVKRR